MRTILRAWCLGMVLIAIGWSGAQAQAWIEIRPEGGRYSILMPGAAQNSSEPISLPDGRTVSMRQTIHETADAAYLGTFTDYPADVMAGQDPEALLIRVRDGSARGHTVRRDQRISIAGNPGREYVIVQANGIVLVTRSLLVGQRLYQWIAAGRGNIETRPETRNFIDSFMLLAN